MDNRTTFVFFFHNMAEKDNNDAMVMSDRGTFEMRSSKGKLGCDPDRLEERQSNEA